MKKIAFALVVLALAGCGTGPILTSRPSQSGAVSRASATAPGYSSASVAASPLPKAELVGQIRSKTSVEPCQTLIVDTDGRRWEVWLPDGYKMAFEGQGELIYDPDGAVVARTGQTLGVDIDETGGLGSVCMAGRPVQATKVVFVTDAKSTDTTATKAWPCSPPVAAPAYKATPGITPPPAYLGSRRWDVRANHPGKLRLDGGNRGRGCNFCAPGLHQRGRCASDFTKDDRCRGSRLT